MRSKTPFLVLSLFLAVVFVVVLFLFLQEEEREPVGGRTDAGTTTQQAQGEVAAPQTLEAPEEAAGSGSGLAATEKRDTRESVPGGPTHALRGAVHLPEGTPKDEKLYVVAVTESLDTEDLYEDFGPASAPWNPDYEDDDVLAWAEVAGDGTFALELPEEHEVAHLGLSGRYLYSQLTSKVELPQATSDLVLTAELGAWITGTVQAPLGVDVSIDESDLELGPDIMSSGFDPDRIQKVAYEVGAKVGADGSFEFRAIPCSLLHGVVLKHDLLATFIELGIETEPGEHRQLELRINEGATLQGRVVDPENAGVAGAELEVRYPGQLGRMFGTLRETETDEEGYFTLSNVYLGEVALAVEKDGFRNYNERIENELSDGQIVADIVIVLDRGGSLAGRVTFPDGAPAPEAEVRAYLDVSTIGPTGLAGVDAEDGGKATTDEDGRFVIQGLGDITFELRANLEIEEGDRAGTWRTLRRGLKAGADSLDIVLEKLSTVVGFVEDTAGEPVTDFTVYADRPGTGGMMGIGKERRYWPVTESEDGRFEAEELHAGDWEMSILAEGYSTSKVQTVTTPTEEVLKYVLLPDSSIAGFVYDTTGSPISGAEVTLDLDLGQMMEGGAKGNVPTTTSNSDGSYLLEGVDPGSVSLIATYTGYAASAPVPVDVQAGELYTDVVLRLRTGGTLLGQVIGKDGEPAEGRMVVVQVMPTYSRRHILTSDSAGEFVAEHLEPGSWQVVAMNNFLTDDVEGGAQDEMSNMLQDMEMDVVDIVDGEETHVLLGKPAQDAVRVYGRVTLDGDPVDGIMVAIVPDGATGMGDMEMVFTDEDGAYEVELEKRGLARITVQTVPEVGMQSSIEYSHEIPEDVEEHVIDFELPLGRITGRVRSADGSPAASCRVTLNVEGGIVFGTFLGGNYVETTTDSDGRYELSYLREGTYTVSAGGVPMGGMLGGDAAHGRQSRSGIRVEENQSVDRVDFELQPPGELKGVVYASNGTPLQEAYVFVRNEDGTLLERFSINATNAAGVYSYKGLSPGSYTISAKSGDEVSAESDAVRVDPGEVSEMDVTLSSGTVIKVKVTDMVDADVEARVSVTDSSGREVSGMLTMAEIMGAMESGFSLNEQAIGPLPPGKYSVRAILADGRQAKKSVTLSGKPERSVKLRVR